nr:ubiquitin carboxyl-terminal hydrolase 25-like isoform X2 [Equus asinus]
MPTRTRCATIEQSKNGSKDKRDLDVIDLTGDDKDDLQRAIALSLAESNRAFRETGMTDEEQAISSMWFRCVPKKDFILFSQFLKPA